MRSIENHSHYHVVCGPVLGPECFRSDVTLLTKKQAEEKLVAVVEEYRAMGATDVLGSVKKGRFIFDVDGMRYRANISDKCSQLDHVYAMARKEGCVDWPDYYNRVLVGIRPGDYVVLITRPGKDREAIWLITGDLTRALDQSRTYAANPEVGTCAVEWVDPITKKLMRWRVGDAASTEGSWAKTING